MKKSQKNAGSASVYFILIFTVILSLILMLIEGARKNAVALKIECAMDLSMSSVFAEYNRELLNQYELFFIDTSYGTAGAGMDQTAEHLKKYLNDNFETDGFMGEVKDLLGLSAEDVTISDFSLASDEDGAVLKKQAVAYMKDMYGVSVLEGLDDQINTVKSKGFLTRNIEGERLAYQSEIDNYEIPPKQIDEDEWEEVELHNPADAVNSSRGILSFVLPEEAELSNVGVNLSNYISHRSQNKGNGLQSRSKPTLTDEFLFNEYILKKTGNYVHTKKNGELQYQTEYILKGKDSDIENLKAVVIQLLVLREVSNLTYLYSDAAKCGEAEALALTVTSAAGCPVLTEPVKQTLLFAWAYAESVYDVRQLLSGGKIPLMKDAGSWHYSLEAMFDYASDTSVAAENGVGLSYGDYLRIFLCMEDADTKALRMMDVIEMDVRKTAGNYSFRLDACADYIRAEAFISGDYGTNHSIERAYYYEK